MLFSFASSGEISTKSSGMSSASQGSQRLIVPERWCSVRRYVVMTVGNCGPAVIELVAVRRPGPAPVRAHPAVVLARQHLAPVHDLAVHELQLPGVDPGATSGGTVGGEVREAVDRLLRLVVVAVDLLEDLQ